MLTIENWRPNFLGNDQFFWAMIKTFQLEDQWYKFGQF